MSPKELPPKVRESGYYWCRERSTNQVFVARWIDVTQSWVLTGWDGFLPDEDIEILGPRLEPPKG